MRWLIKASALISHMATHALVKTTKRLSIPKARLCWPCRTTRTVLFSWQTTGIQEICLIHVISGCLSRWKQMGNLEFLGVATGMFPFLWRLETNPIYYEIIMRSGFVCPALCRDGIESPWRGCPRTNFGDAHGFGHQCPHARDK